jgi:hypothetical protein
MFEEGAEEATIQVGAGARLNDQRPGRPSTHLRVTDTFQPWPGDQQCTGLSQSLKEAATAERGAHGVVLCHRDDSGAKNSARSISGFLR